MPARRNTSRNHSTGSLPSARGLSQAYVVLVLPSTRPQLMAPTFPRFNSRMMVAERLLRGRAMYSVHVCGRPVVRNSWMSRRCQVS